MPRSITPQQLAGSAFRPVIVDVRKPPAKAASGWTIPGALLGDPGNPHAWVGDLPEGAIVVFCVHGHEISQGIAAQLALQGRDVAYLEGGFEAWKSAGGAVTRIGEAA